MSRAWWAIAGLARMTEGIPKHGGVVVLSATDTPLGFGIACHSTLECTSLDPMANVVLHQADIGDYLRTMEDA